MLMFKILKGSEAGKILNLKEGDNVIGRGPNCDVIINSQGVSKSHAKLVVRGSQCVLTDLNSSNGTFVNGAKIKDRILRVGDRIGFHNIIVELAHESSPRMENPGYAPMGAGMGSGGTAFQQQPMQGFQGQPMPGVAFNPQGQPQMNGMAAPNAMPAEEHEKGTAAFAKRYLEEIILPGVYSLAEIYPIKNLLAVFLALFMIMLTALSTVPMAALSKESIQKEAQRRAITLARQLATSSEKVLAAGTEGIIRTDFVENEDGVISALVVSREDGHIIAPLTKAQSYSTDEFVARARKFNEEIVKDMGNNTLNVSVPVRGFSSEAGQSVILAYAIVSYKMDSLDWGGTVGLFARILLIAMALGFVLYYLFYRLMIQPIIEATSQMDEALRGERETLTIKYKFDVFEKLLDAVNSAVSRMSAPSDKAVVTYDKTSEASNLVRIVTDPAIAIDGDGKILQVNAAFEELTGMRLLTLQGQPLEALQDQALRLNLEDLITKGRSSPAMIMSSTLEINGIFHEIDVQVAAKEDDPTQASYIFGTIKKRGEP